MSETTRTPTQEANGTPASGVDNGTAVETTSVLASPTETVPAQVEPPVAPSHAYLRGLTTATYVLLFVVLVVYLLSHWGFLLKPLLIAGFLGYVLGPVERWFRRQGLPGSVAAVFMLVITLSLIVGVGYLAYSGLNSLDVKRLGEYEDQLDQVGRRLLEALGFHQYARTFQVRELIFSEQGLNIRLNSMLASLSGTFFNFITVSVVVVLYTVFLWLEWNDLPGRIDQAFGQERGAAIRDVLAQINEAITRYLGVLTLLCLLQGVIAAATLGLLQVDFALLWGTLLFLLCFIPYFGPFIGVSLPVLVTFMQYPDQPWRGIVALVVLVTVNQVTDNVLNPHLNGHKLGISPLLILLALSFWGWLWGVVGLLLAVPLTVSLKIILERIELTRPIAVLMSDR
jgi:predicted PurR-regulated permease PerM